MAGEAPTFFTYNTPVGHVTVASDGAALTQLVFGERLLSGDRRPTELTNKAANQLQEYLAGKRTAFDLPLNPGGTAFQQRVWAAARAIPYGETRRYQDVSRDIGSPHAGRAVGVACSKNPLPIIIPSHRIVAANGEPGGKPQERAVRNFLLGVERRRP